MAPRRYYGLTWGCRWVLAPDAPTGTRCYRVDHAPDGTLRVLGTGQVVVDGVDAFLSQAEALAASYEPMSAVERAVRTGVMRDPFALFPTVDGYPEVL